MNTTYAIRVDGHLDDHWSAWLGDLDLTRDDDGTTTLTVSVADQAQLHGVLAGLRDIGVVLTEVRTARPCRPVLDRPLHTERLTLRPATAADAGPTGSLRRLAPVDEWRTARPAGHREWCSEPARLAATVIVVLGHDAAAPIIGDLILRRADAQAELGWVLDPAYPDHAVEALRELLRHCFQELGLRRVTADCFLDDDRSWRLVERAGMRRERHAVRASLHRSGRWLDTVGYAILDEECPDTNT